MRGRRTRIKSRRRRKCRRSRSKNNRKWRGSKSNKMKEEMREESKVDGSAHTQIGEEAAHEPPDRDASLVLDR